MSKELKPWKKAILGNPQNFNSPPAQTKFINEMLLSDSCLHRAPVTVEMFYWKSNDFSSNLVGNSLNRLKILLICI